MKTTPITRLICLYLLSIGLFACKKNQDTPPGPEEQEEFAAISAESDASAEAIFSSVFDNVVGVNSEVGIGGTGIFNNATPLDTMQCFSIEVIHLNPSAAFPIQVVVDFGRECVGRDGRIRKGRVITEYSNRLTVSGASAITRFDGYIVDDIKIEGEHVVINKSSSAVPTLETKVAARLSTLNGDFSQWNSERTITQAGRLTSLASDDSFSVTGSASGFAKKGDKLFQWTTVISEPLIKKFACRWTTEGIVTIKKGTTAIAVLDYGTGQCDNKASFTVFGHVREITLH
jgi:hypothetical protein